MKKINLLSMLAFAAYVAVSFNACKGDDGGDDNESVYNSEEWTEIGDSVKYSVAFTNLDDNDNTLSFKQKYTFVKPIDASAEYSYTFKYESNETIAPDSTVNDSVVEPVDDSAAVDKSNYPIVDGRIEVICSNTEVAEMLYETMLEDTVDYTVVLDGTIIKCEWKKSTLSEMTYASVIRFFETLKKSSNIDFNQGGNVSDTTQNNNSEVLDTKNAVVIGVEGVALDVFKTGHAYYSISSAESGDSTLVTFWFSNYDFNKKERKPNVLTLSVVVSGKIDSLAQLPTDTLKNVAISFMGNKPSTVNFFGIGSVLVSKNDRYTVEVFDMVHNITTVVHPFTYIGSISYFDATKVEEEEEIENPGHNGIEGNVEETENKITMKLENKEERFTETYDAEFVNDKCTNCTYIIEYSNEQYAALVYETLKTDENKKCSLNGKTIIVDITKEYNNMSKEEVKKVFEALKKAYQSK